MVLAVLLLIRRRVIYWALPLSLFCFPRESSLEKLLAFGEPPLAVVPVTELCGVVFS